VSSQELPAPVAEVKPEAPVLVPTDATRTRAAGRGGLAIAGAKVSFILFGFAQQLLLPRLLGVDGYGEVSRVLAIVGVVNNVVVATSIQGVSRAVSSVPEDRADEAFARTLRVHAVIAIVLSLLFALLAGTVASAVGAAHVAAPLRIAGAVVLLYGVYAPLIGALNGRRRFGTQAALDTGYGAVRLLAMAGGAWLFGVSGAVIGFVAAAAAIVPIAATRSGLGRAGTAGPSVGSYLGFLGPLAIGQVCLNLLMQTDFFLLSRFLGDAAAASGQLPAAADRMVGVYRGVQLFAFLPYQMLMSITFVLFPMLARAHAEGDRPAVGRYTAMGVRIALITTGLMCGTVAALAPHVLRFAFPVEMADNGGAALRILALGMGAFSMLGIVSSALTSLARERASALLTAITVVAIAAGCFALVPRAAFGPDMLVSSATATSLALLLAAIIGAVLLRGVAGAFVSPLTLVRVGVAMAATVAVGTRVPWLGKLAVLVEVVGVALVYLGVLVVSGEIGRKDLATVRAGLGRRA